MISLSINHSITDIGNMSAVARCRSRAFSSLACIWDDLSLTDELILTSRILKDAKDQCSASVMGDSLQSNNIVSKVAIQSCSMKGLAAG